MKVVALVGSLRKDSYNKQLVESIGKRYSNLFEVEILDIKNLPFYNQDDELTPPETVVHFWNKVKEADAVFICTPEFNWSISGVLKNALEWLSRVERPIAGKPVLPMGTSTGYLGTARAQLHLRQILSSVQAVTISPAGNEIFVSFANEKFENGALTDEKTFALLDRIMDKFVALVKEQ